MSILFTFLTIKHKLKIFTAERNSYCVMALSKWLSLTTQERESGVDLSKTVSNMSLFFCVFASQSLTSVLRQFKQSTRFSHTIAMTLEGAELLKPTPTAFQFENERFYKISIFQFPKIICLILMQSCAIREQRRRKCL